ncbi:MAG: hypothetical protein IH599_02180 [Bacteroidales bacterium]|nr:hypothetical protein [Bacteroidales bacterium]
MKHLSASGKIVLIMTVVVAVASVIIWRHYRNLNAGVDPRIIKARELYGSYNASVAAGDYPAVLALLDTAEEIYSGIPHYADSWEMGVLRNNRAALCLTIALYADSIPAENHPFPGVGQDSLITLTADHLAIAMKIYESMDDQYGGLTQEQIAEQIRDEFLDGLEDYESEAQDRFIETRAKEIINALTEKDMRMSVCHTNLGIVARYRTDYEGAIEHYQTALRLWDRNLEAENNLNSLLGLPLKKRNFLQKLFPPQRGSNKTDSL